MKVGAAWKENDPRKHFRRRGGPDSSPKIDDSLGGAWAGLWVIEENRTLTCFEGQHLAPQEVNPPEDQQINL